MPPPATADELFDLVRKSGVVEDARLTTYLSQTATAPVPKLAANELVRDGLLTYFQAEQILQGKWKRFTIGKYRILEKLGTGGMGQVFLCEHKVMRRRVAVKVLPAAKAVDPASLERFYREARAVAALDHPNIVRAYDIDQDESLHFIVMEYVDGASLQELVVRFGPLDPTRAAHYIYGTAVGLHHAHEMGLIHRDIKPANILIDRGGVVKVLDMGLARFFNPDENDLLTKKYDENVLGTADYLAPEQAVDSSAVDIRADLYALGGTFYFLLTGKTPFPEGTVAHKLMMHQTKEPAAIKRLRPDAPSDLIAVVQKLMAKDPAARYQTPAELMTALADRVRTPIAPPADAEMPRLSPAVVAGRVTNGSTLTLSLGSTPIPRAKTISATHPALPPVLQPVAAVRPAAAVVERDPAVQLWCQLASETTRSQTDTMRAVPGTASPPRTRRRSLAIAIGVVVGVMGISGIVASFWPKAKPADSPPARADQ